MIKKKKRFIIPGIIAVLLLAGAVVFVRSPFGIALLKSKSHFITHPSDTRVLYEPGAETYADKIAAFLPEAIKRVEQGHFKPFSKPFNVYVCYTQESHNEFVANPTNYPTFTSHKALEFSEWERFPHGSGKGWPIALPAK